jgi:hypothetical protein
MDTVRGHDFDSVVKTVVLGHCNLPYNPVPMPFHYNIQKKGVICGI